MGLAAFLRRHSARRDDPSEVARSLLPVWTESISTFQSATELFRVGSGSLSAVSDGVYVCGYLLEHAIAATIGGDRAQVFQATTISDIAAWIASAASDRQEWETRYDDFMKGYGGFIEHYSPMPLFPATEDGRKKGTAIWEWARETTARHQAEPMDAVVLYLEALQFYAMVLECLSEVA